EIALPQALQIATPLTLSLSDGGRRALFTLRRESDPAEEVSGQLIVTWKGKGRITPGVLVAALTRASDDRFDTGDLAEAYEGPDHMMVRVSEGLVSRLALPCTVTASGREVTLSGRHGDTG
ncbi:MAG: hypothetical protein QF464_12420, partial [Myxococcota bacterium]|nr:hypothetical protein [Myxococcota bacterium]